MTVRVGEAAQAPDFPSASHELLQNAQLRRNVRRATEVIRAKRNRVVAETPDWEELREAARQIKDHTLRHLDFYLEQFEENCSRAGGQVHWAQDADEANRIIVEILQERGHKEVIKVKTMTSDEIGLNAALEDEAITPYETDLADLIVQLGNDRPSHIVVPALHRNRNEIRQLFMEKMGLKELGDRPEDLTAAARAYLRDKFLRVEAAISGANFAVAETGSVCVVESEGNGRMCLSLPKLLITLVGIEKIIPHFTDLEVFLQLLPRSATGERMNPYNSIWTGFSASDGPQEFHVVLLDNGRTNVLADADAESAGVAGRAAGTAAAVTSAGVTSAKDTLDCIRCGACLNVCPVYRQTGGHAYGSVYAGPIGAILTPQLQSMQHSQSLPYASSLCGACYEVCPVKINIPEILIHLRSKIVEQGAAPLSERWGMNAAAFTLARSNRLAVAQKFARVAQWPFERDGFLHNLPGPFRAWLQSRDLPTLPKESFREWWTKTKRGPGK